MKLDREGCLLTNPKINEEKFDKFMTRFNDEIFPTIAGEDGTGVSEFKALIEKKRQNVEARRKKMKKHIANC